ncbi:5-(carboxyamino)imidazole ribonucleotide synthase [Cellulomonas bogoriensis]|uniref:N5-carboxyaminoimidazole ribonucleotide synthase n=1 Tax=Cellulomonas bogoriensis 69B4 = DSM 16987 TaxID=1386082 RepID=A0A0A0C019_9CELL|nr:5-(carboxyamino)imidazole ribonucleotide synthase [Cellulomonas bogoriensis]KGM13257.1 phosphoribosylaminoimidazole carboxylase [Cellulomonas bogoriensis 69B4 = DSM 16987]
MTAPVVAVVGGGQLARMMAPAATALGIDLRVLTETADGSAARVVRSSVVGLPRDDGSMAAVLTEPRSADVLTFEHEHIPATAFARARDVGVPAHPAEHALLYAQDKIEMRRRLTGLGVPCPDWTELPGPGALEGFLRDHGGVAVVKTARGGYDGKGVRVVRSVTEVTEWFAAARIGGPALLAEAKVPFVRELAVLLARRPSGELRCWPVAQTVQADGVCSVVVAPAPDLSPEVEAEALRAARTVAEGLDVTGVLAVEMFEVPGDGAGGPRVLVNELAMRPHNSGHWTIDGAVTSQFEQHLRAVLDLPLGSTETVGPWSVMANVLGSGLGELTDGLATVLSADPGAKVHLYGKEIRSGRKLGHVTVVGEDLHDVRDRALAAAARLRGETVDG